MGPTSSLERTLFFKVVVFKWVEELGGGNFHFNERFLVNEVPVSLDTRWNVGDGKSWW